MMLPKVVSTALVGPNSLFREGLKGILHAPYQAEVIAEAFDHAQQITAVDLIILVADTDQSNLLVHVRRAKEANTNARVVVMGDTDPSAVAWPLLDAGADGYLLKKISPEALRASLDAVMLGATVVLPTPRNAFMIDGKDCARAAKSVVEAQAPKLATEAEYKKLSDRETEILLCLTKGESNKQIARKCEITEATVKVHLKAILRKIRVSNRTQAAVWAHNNQLARPAHLPPAALADYRQDASCGPSLRPKYAAPHEDHVRQNLIVRASARSVADSVN